MNESKVRTPVGESAEWEAAYCRTRRSIPKRRSRLEFFNWPGPSARILDLGSGDGLDLIATREMGYYEVVAFDASTALLSGVAGSKVAGDAHHLPFDSDRFDIVLANSVLHHFDFPKMVGEIARILKPNGSFCFMEPRPTWARTLLDTLTMNDFMGRIVPYFRHRKQGLLEEYEVHYRWLDLYPRVHGILEQNGFTLTKEKRTLVGVFAQWRWDVDRRAD